MIYIQNELYDIREDKDVTWDKIKILRVLVHNNITNNNRRRA